MPTALVYEGFGQGKWLYKGRGGTFVDLTIYSNLVIILREIALRDVQKVIINNVTSYRKLSFFAHILSQLADYSTNVYQPFETELLTQFSHRLQTPLKFRLLTNNTQIERRKSKRKFSFRQGNGAYIFSEFGYSHTATSLLQITNNNISTNDI